MTEEKNKKEGQEILKLGESGKGNDQLGLGGVEGDSKEKADVVISRGDNSKKIKKRIKNYLSVIILLAGLLAGSVFVDVAQFVSRQGASPKALKESDIFTLDDRTWVAYSEPIIKVQVLTDSKCEDCDPTETLKWLKRVIPTLLAESVEIDSSKGEKLISQFNVKSVPAFIFDENITKSDVYAQAREVFTKINDGYLMNSEQVGIKPGKYLLVPGVGDSDDQLGLKDSKVKVILFSDFQCPYSKMFYEQSFKKILEDYKDKVLFVYKQLPLDFHERAKQASMASECAGEQGKFWEMADKLYATQKDWSDSKASADAKFKAYAASFGLSMSKFNECMSQSKFEDKISADSDQAKEFGISGTPSFFVGDQFSGGVVGYEEMKKMIEEQLGE